MEIDSESFLEIMKKNFNLKTVKTELGEGIKIDCYSAFIYSTITGSGYLENSVFPFTPKGLLKIFYNAFNYNFITGIFDNTSLKYTPYNLYLSRRYLFEGEKVIIPVEFNSEIELQRKLEYFIEKKGNEKNNYLIQRIELSKKGNGMEPFLEYLCSEYFRKEGYLVETQIPLSYRDGTPDFGGYRIFKFQEYLHNTNLPLSNIHIIELAMLRLRLIMEEKNNRKISSDFFIIGEAKTSTLEMKEQLKKYMGTKIFNEGYQISPGNLKSYPHFGSLEIDKNYKIIVKEPEIINNNIDKNLQKEYSLWLSNYLKYYLISNLTNDEFNEFYVEKNKSIISGKEDLISFINNLEYDEIIKKIKEICYGSV